MCILRAFLRREVAIAVVAVPRRGAGEGGEGREEGGSGEGDSRSRVPCQGKPRTPPLGAGWGARVSPVRAISFNEFIFLN